jgi:NAD(P)-dependent dehydrogenase (short-subunit alcohol dehydrogenase family)
MATIASIWTQFFPPRNGAPLTEANLPSQAGKVFIVTGGSSGLGYELSRILYGTGGKVYMLTRSKEHADDAAARIQAFYKDRDDLVKPRGSLHFVFMDLMDLFTVKAAAEEFLRRETKLDVLFNNAGTGALKNAPATHQGHEYHFGVNSLGGFLLARLLSPILSQTAQQAPSGSVRVVWPASCLVEMMAPEGGIRSSFMRDTNTVTDQNELYSSSKVASWFVASEFARRQQRTGSPGDGAVLHIAGNPGNYRSNIWRHTPTLLYWLLRPILRDPVHGAETYLFMALSESVTLDDAAAGRYVICDGRWHPGQRQDLLLALRDVEEGGSGRAKEYFDWCEDKVQEFVK